MPGYDAWNDTSAGASTDVTRLGVAPTAKRPRTMPDSARASAPVASTSASTRCMNGSSADPSGVSVTRP